MPSRIIRNGFLDSVRVNSLTTTAETAYVRALLVADDAGRLDGRFNVLASSLYPTSQLKDGDIERRISECVKEGLIIAYQFEGKPYLQITKWQRCGNARRSAFPWKDGTYEIRYIKAPSRDGDRDYVSSSLSDGIPMPSASHPHGISDAHMYSEGTRLEKDQGRECEGRGKEKPFVRPHADAMREYGLSLNPALPAVESLKCFNYYEANGWKVGRNPMKNWHAAMINWRTNWLERMVRNNGERKPNPRNFGVATDPIEQGKQIAEYLERKAKADNQSV